MRLRVGRKVGRTIYLQLGDEPSDEDVLVGVVDTAALAQFICDCVDDVTRWVAHLGDDVIVGELVELATRRGER